MPPEAYRQFLLAELARGADDPVATERHFRRALAEDPGSAYLRLRLAELAVADGRLAQALSLVRAARRVAPRDPESCFLHGRLLAIRRPRAAQRALERALRLDPTHEAATLWLARVRLRRGDPAGERRVLLRLLKLRPDNAEVLYALARAQVRQGRRTQGIRLLQRLLAAHPFAVRPRLMLARLQLLQGRPRRAEQALLDAMEASGDDPIVAQELFRLHGVAGRSQRARDLVTLMSVHASAPMLTFVAALQDALGLVKVARRTLEQALRQDRQHGPAVALKARLLLRAQGPKSALAWLNRVGKKSRALVDARIAAAEIHEAEGHRRTAIRLLAALQRAKPTSAAVAETQALLHARARDLGAALAAVRRAGRLRRRTPDDAQQRYFRALVLEEAGQFGAAVRVARRLVADDPDDVQALNLLGYALARRGVALGEAVRLLHRAQALDPLSPYVLDSLGWARFRQGRYRRAVSLLSRATRADPRMAEPWDHLGDALHALGRRQAARAAYARALARRPDVVRRAVLRGKIARLSP